MHLCYHCLEIYNNNLLYFIGDFVICKDCYNYHNNKLIPIIYNNEDKIVVLKSLQNISNFIDDANLLIHFSKSYKQKILYK
jgi:hypothetical protein